MVKSSKQNIMNLSSLNLEELSGVVSIYPWFSCARLELCRRMAALGEEAWEVEKYAKQALYVPERSRVYEIMKNRKEKKLALAPVKAPKQVYVIGGDYFSAEQYAQAKKAEDNIFSAFINNALEQGEISGKIEEEASSTEDFCTEELAKVYLDQGYTDKAKQIYSKLSLLIPEKSVYFADLIEKIDK
ncbi:MAG: hypothetical protein ACI3ZF_04290 [Candidatus Cryptobacteroides sp.]